jgi:bacterioferritin-associated ferredoxin
MNDFKSPLEQKPDYVVCICWGVMYSEIVDAIKDGCHDFESLQERLMVGTGCSTCVQ